MKRDPLAIIQEYQHSSDPQIRKNAATALAALGSEESVKRLVDMTLADAEIRDHGIKELSNLEAGARRYVGPQVQTALQNPKHQRVAYLVLALLHGEGIEIELPKLSIKSRLRLFAGLSKLIYPKHRFRLAFRRMLPALIGGIVGALLLGIYVTIFFAGSKTYSTPNDLAVMLFWAALSAPLLALPASWRAIPVGLQPDRNIAFVAGFSVLSLFIVIYMSLIFFGRGFFNDIAEFTSLPFFLVMLIAGVRMGTHLEVNLSGNATFDRVVKILVGASAGAVIMIPLVVLFAELGYLDNDFWPAIWLFFIPACFGMANAYSQIDSGFAKTRLLKRPVARYVNLGVATALLLPMFVVLIPERPAVETQRTTRVDDEASGQSGVVRTKQWETSEGHGLDFNVNFTQRISASVQDTWSSYYASEYVLFLFKREGGRYILHNHTALCEKELKQSVIEDVLSEGEYRIAGVNLYDKTGRLMEELACRGDKGSRDKLDYRSLHPLIKGPKVDADVDQVFELLLQRLMFTTGSPNQQRTDLIINLTLNSDRRLATLSTRDFERRLGQFKQPTWYLFTPEAIAEDPALAKAALALVDQHEVRAGVFHVLIDKQAMASQRVPEPADLPALVLYENGKPLDTRVAVPDESGTVVFVPRDVSFNQQWFEPGKSFVNQSSLEKRVKKIIIEQLGVREEAVTNGASFVGDLGADALDTVELVMAFEEEFETHIPDEEAEKITTVQDAIDYLSAQR